jgi:hypothetical protein
VNDRGTRAAIGLAITAAIVRLVPLQFLHPLNWDEIEFFEAAKWIAEGRVPFRDFWEHHTPLAWFVFAPFTLLTDSPGAGAILLLRWAQIPVWVAAFWLANTFMRQAGLSRFARWAAMALALSSSFLMTSAIEFRLDPLSCALYMAGLVLWQRGTPRSMFGAGAMFCLTGLTNMRLGPLLVVTVLLLLCVRERKWRIDLRAGWIIAGGVATLAVALCYFAATDSFGPMLQHLIRDNVFGDKFGKPVLAGFIHRLLVPFGVRAIASDRLFEWAAVDFGGIALLLLGFAGLIGALLRWREPDELFVIGLLETVGLAVIARMNFIYNYHFQLVVMMMLPLVASALGRITRRGLVLALLAVACCVNVFASVFRGKEIDLAYQDRVMREVHARTRPGDRVWSGIPWALRREPAFRLWFLPDMTRQMVSRGYTPGYPLEDVLRDPPAALVVDHYAMLWLARVQRELTPYFVHHYIPVWRNVWIPAMNGRLRPGATAQWVVPRDGTYRVYTSPDLARHPWFRTPLLLVSYKRDDASRYTVRLPEPDRGAVQFLVDDRPAATLTLRKGQRLTALNTGPTDVAVILLPTSDRVLFRQPPPGATLEGERTRITHVPYLGAHLSR